MPPSSFLKKLKVDHCARLVLTADLEFDATNEDLDVEADLSGSDPLPEMNPQTGKPYTGMTLEISQEELKAASRTSNGVYNVAQHRAYRYTISFEHVQYPSSRERQAEGRELARRTAGLHLEQLPHNVRLFCPHAHKDGAELWVKGDILSRSSPYLKDLLSSGFAEAQPRRSKRARTSGGAETTAA
ncbi:hypothetical protein JCM10213_002078, partial [Rhodosporidiobolus nylandii]